MAGAGSLGLSGQARKLKTPAQSHQAVSLRQDQVAFSFDERVQKSQAGETQPREPTAWVPPFHHLLPGVSGRLAPQPTKASSEHLLCIQGPQAGCLFLGL